MVCCKESMETDKMQLRLARGLASARVDRQRRAASFCLEHKSKNGLNCKFDPEKEPCFFNGMRS